jgi:polyadenylate-binding protein
VTNLDGNTTKEDLLAMFG